MFMILCCECKKSSLDGEVQGLSGSSMGRLRELGILFRGGWRSSGLYEQKEVREGGKCQWFVTGQRRVNRVPR